MQTKRPEVERPRTSVYLITFIALVVLAVGIVACNYNRGQQNQNQNGNAPRSLGESPSPSASPKPSGSPEFVPADTIIIVRDGSVKIEVNKSKLCADDDDPSQPADKKYKCNNIELGHAEIKTVNGSVPNIPALTPNSKITIDGGGDKEVEIKGNPNHVTIKFKKAHYPSCGQPGEHCGTNHVGTIKIDSFTKTCTVAEKCELIVKKK